MFQQAVEAQPDAQAAGQRAVQLVVTCFAFFLGTAAAAFLPFALFISEAKVRLATVLGAGLLLGAALQVVIPEGFEAWGEAQQDPSQPTGPAWLPGLALLAGFLAMELLYHAQQLASLRLPATPPASNGWVRASSHDGAFDALDAVRSEDPPPPPALAGSLGSQPPCGCASASPYHTVVALVIHAAADGLSLGVASASGSERLEAVVAMALVLHKAPVAFGLATYLMQVRFPWSKTKGALLLFSAATPLVALATYFVLGALPLQSSSAIAVCLLFSGGTVLHAAATHILPEALGRASGQTPTLMSCAQLLVFIVGALLPLVLHVLPMDEH